MPIKKPLTTSLAEARQLRPQLDAATDALNATFVKLEKALAKEHLGVRAEVKLYEFGTDDEDPVAAGNTSLVFSKWENAWRLLLVNSYAHGGVEDEVTLLVKGSRSDRLCAAERLGDLVAAMRAEVQKELDAVGAADREAKSVLAALEYSEPPHGDEDASF